MANETIQIWIDETDPARPYIVSRGVNGADAPNTLAACTDHAEASAAATRFASESGLRIIDETL